MKCRFGEHEFEVGGKYLDADLRDCNDIIHDSEALRARMDNDGYLLVRGLRTREDVLKLRHALLAKLSERGVLDPKAPFEDGVINPEGGVTATTSVRNKDDLRALPQVGELVRGAPVLGFFERFLGGPVMPLNFEWLRVAGTGASSAIHCDVVFMGRGTKRLFTCWTPIGDVSLEMGPIVLCLGSHRFEKIKQTYGEMDVDRDLIAGYFSTDPVEMVEKFGGRWSTTSFKAGDVLIFGMYLLHASLTNTTDRFRISVDARYQLASDPADDRWIGDPPKMHYAFWQPGVRLEPLEVSRAKWGV